MSIKIPPAINYNAPLIAVIDRLQNAPNEGNRRVAFEIDWGTSAGQNGGANNCVNINMQNNATLEFSQVCMLYVDNSESGGDVDFIFTDSGQTYTVPAYSPAELFPVLTNSTQFFISSPGALPGDVTVGAILNYNTFPSSIDVTTEQQNASFTAITNAAATTALIPAGVTGTIENIFVTVSPSGTHSDVSTLVIQDGEGTPKIIASATAQWTNTPQTFTMLDLAPMAVRFENGLNLVVSGAANAPDATISANILYRTP